MRNNIPIRERENESDTLKLKTLFGNALKALVYSGAFLFPRQRTRRACLHAHLTTDARVSNPAVLQQGC